MIESFYTRPVVQILVNVAVIAAVFLFKLTKVKKDIHYPYPYLNDVDYSFSSMLPHAMIV